MHRRTLVIPLVVLAAVSCDVSPVSDAVVAVSPSPSRAATIGAAVSIAPAATASASAAPTAPPAPPAPAAATNAPAPAVVGARVTVLPSSTGKLGSGFILQLSGFPVGPFTTTITNPNGIPKSQLGQIGADGKSSVTFATTLQDLVGRYTFRFDAAGTSVTTVIDVTR